MTTRHHRRRLTTVFVAVLACAGLGTGVAGADAGFNRGTPGADGAGDSYYPQDGNGGYDVADYNLAINYTPATKQLIGTQRISARATQSLSSFDLDFSGLTVDSIDVDGRHAAFTRTGDHELVITPSRVLRRGEVFNARIQYHGVPEPISDPLLGDNGWQYSASGGAFAAGEPKSASTWYPVNDTPLDKATFHLAVTVPDEWGVIANGRERGTTKTANGTTHFWAEDTPAVPYMTTVAIEKWQFERSRLANGTPVVSAYAPGTPDATKTAEAKLPEILDFLSSKFGPYPVDAAGGIFLAEPIGFSLETLSRPIYSGRAGNVGTIVHENAHQWYGDTVAVDKWKDVCLNECFASYAQWLWSEAKDGKDLNARYLSQVATASDNFWSGKLYDMGPGNEFTAVYAKGPLALHALRNTIGEKAFDFVLKTWPALHRNGNASLPEFQAYAEKISHQNLKGFFDAWFYGNTKPAPAYLYPGTLKPTA
ncbi:MAG: peptidase [Amycolatopsis sp.]|jgi:aminopeptidase N|uniref:M1 family metallopeptidase n=1 Tax=Amycolatopsis sp. TaxID=37632 RepID=UPI0026151C70|nr:M1 family metallopeptidase [Amycolatopsis sp.]MCU1687280.1 peptidase [Amycolatopsis sp.]